MRTISSIQFSEINDPELCVQAETTFSDGTKAKFAMAYTMRCEDPECDEDHHVGPTRALTMLLIAMGKIIEEQDLLESAEVIDISKRTH